MKTKSFPIGKLHRSLTTMRATLNNLLYYNDELTPTEWDNLYAAYNKLGDVQRSFESRNRAFLDLEEERKGTDDIGTGKAGTHAKGLQANGRVLQS